MHTRLPLCNLPAGPAMWLLPAARFDPRWYTHKCLTSLHVVTHLDEMVMPIFSARPSLLGGSLVPAVVARSRSLGRFSRSGGRRETKVKSTQLPSKGRQGR